MDILLLLSSTLLLFVLYLLPRCPCGQFIFYVWCEDTAVCDSVQAASDDGGVGGDTSVGDDAPLMIALADGVVGNDARLPQNPQPTHRR